MLGCQCFYFLFKVIVSFGGVGGVFLQRLEYGGIVRLLRFYKGIWWVQLKLVVVFDVSFFVISCDLDGFFVVGCGLFVCWVFVVF